MNLCIYVSFNNIVQIFGNLDKLDDTEVEEIMHFKGTIMDYVPKLSPKAYQESCAELNKLDKDDHVFSPTKGTNYLDCQFKVSSLKLDAESSTGQSQLNASLSTKLSDQVINGEEEYNLPPGPITYQSACQIFELYRCGAGGRISTSSVQRILRGGYRSLMDLPNVVNAHIDVTDKNQKCTVVGDLHGQLSDLVYIMEESGLPSSDHMYIFNGDFVDRGAMGVEVTLLLLAFRAALPDRVFLNRGNHEDFAICCVYGFQRECCTKYDEITFGMFVELFQYLPVCTILNEAVLVIHGGLFHDTEITLDEINQLTRNDFTLQDLPVDGEEIDGIDKVNDRENYLKQVQRDALWSDPCVKLGKNESTRGAGIGFGADVTQKFLKNNNLSFIIRSHECVRRGFFYPYADTEGSENVLCTLFSASNYGDSKNSGAYMEIKPRKQGNRSRAPTSEMLDLNALSNKNSKVGLNEVVTTSFVLDNSVDIMIPDTMLSYTVTEYQITQEMELNMRKAFKTHALTVHDLIMRKKAALLKTFARHAREHNEIALDQSEAEAAGRMPLPEDTVRLELLEPNHVTVEMWAQVMGEVINTKLHWGTMLMVLVPSSCRHKVTHDVNYVAFLNELTKSNATGGRVRKRGSLGAPRQQRRPSAEELQKQLEEAAAEKYSMIESLYSQHKNMEAIFDFFDINDTGFIEEDEFVAQCTEINKSLSSEHHIKKAKELFHMMDIDLTGTISANEFFEIFRIVELRYKQLMIDRAESLKKPKSFFSRTLDNAHTDVPDPSPGGTVRVLELEDVQYAFVENADEDTDSEEEVSKKEESGKLDDDDDSVVPDHIPHITRKSSISVGGKDIVVD